VVVRRQRVNGDLTLVEVNVTHNEWFTKMDPISYVCYRSIESIYLNHPGLCLVWMRSVDIQVFCSHLMRMWGLRDGRDVKRNTDSIKTNRPNKRQIYVIIDKLSPPNSIQCVRDSRISVSTEGSVWINFIYNAYSDRKRLNLRTIQDSQCMCNLSTRHVRVTTSAVEKE